MSRHGHTLPTQMHTRSEGQRDRPTWGQVRALQKYAGAHVWHAHVWLAQGREQCYADAHRQPICHQAHGPPDERSWQLCSVWPWASPDPTCLGPASACGLQALEDPSPACWPSGKPVPMALAQHQPGIGAQRGGSKELPGTKD